MRKLLAIGLLAGTLLLVGCGSSYKENVNKFDETLDNNLRQHNMEYQIIAQGFVSGTIAMNDELLCSTVHIQHQRNDLHHNLVCYKVEDILELFE